jgi:hypothetical protein
MEVFGRFQICILWIPPTLSRTPSNCILVHKPEVVVMQHAPVVPTVPSFYNLVNYHSVEAGGKTSYTTGKPPALGRATMGRESIKIRGVPPNKSESDTRTEW